ncbi:mechanosensitive ion channel [Thermostilla marina]
MATSSIRRGTQRSGNGTECRFGRNVVLRLVLTAVVCCLSSGVFGQSTEIPLAPIAPPTNAEPEPGTTPANAVAASPDATISRDAIQREMESVLATLESDPARRSQVETLYRQALGQLELADKFRSDAERYRALTASIPQDEEAAKQELASLTEALEEEPGAADSIEELERQLDEKQKALDEARKLRDALEAEAARRMSARGDLPKRAEAARQRRQEIEARMKAFTPGDDPVVTRAQVVVLQAQWAAAFLEEEACTAELEYYRASAESLFPLQRRVAEQRLIVAGQLVERWRRYVARRTQQVAEQAAQLAQERLDEIPEQLRPLAETTSKLAADIAEVTNKLQIADDEFAAASAKLEDIRRSFEKMQERLQTVGMNRSLGLLLRTQKASLPDTRRLEADTRKRQEQIRELQWTILDLNDRHVQLPPWDQEVDQWLARLPEDLSYSEQLELERTVTELLRERNELYDRQLRAYNDYLEKLVELDNTRREMLRLVEEYNDFIDEHVFWIRSAPPLTPNELLAAARLTLGVAAHAVSPKFVGDLSAALRSEIVGYLPLWALAAVVFLAWGVFLPRIRARLSKLGDLAKASTCRKYRYTLEALLWTVVEALFVPAVCAFVGWRLLEAADATSAATSVGTALLQVARFVALYSLILGLVRVNGLGEAHFQWPQTAIVVARRQLRWFIPAGAVTIYLYYWIEQYGDERWIGAAGRFLFLIYFVFFAYAAHRIFYPNGRFMRALRAETPGASLVRFRHTIYFLVIAGPIAFMTLAAAGYLYTAAQLSVQFRYTLFLPIALGVLGALFSRWVLLRRRTLAITRAQQKREEMEKEKEKETDSGDGSLLDQFILKPLPELDLALIGEQTQRLVHSLLIVLGCLGLWWIWSEAFPALGILYQIKLWQVTTTVTQTVMGGGGEPISVPVTQAVAVTLADLGLAIIIGIVTWIAARNMSGVVEIVIPRGVRLDPGVRYAIAMVANYAVVTIGGILAFAQLGIGWSQVQWLVAAVGVGLGFGLQEIFANFVSGLIILFERPIRVGDVVTVNGETGIVSKIHIRATTILNWERRELIVPNKSFITSDVLNWTLSDALNRLTFNVGVAYGSDTDRVTELLHEIVRSNPNVLDDPAPIITFDSFGDSTLNFTVRCYLPNLDNRLSTTHQLHSEIHRRFHEEGIEIAFPQQDLHVRSLPKEVVELLRISRQEDRKPNP